jgi:RimJ/RimL family protein N-acetyltransferase
MAPRWSSPAALSHLVVVNGAPAGSSSYLLDDEHSADLEIGATYLARPLWGTGVNGAVKRRMIDVAFAAGAERIRFRTDERNARSAAAIRNLGASAAGSRLEEWIRADGSRRTSLLFTLTRDDWQRRAGAGSGAVDAGTA